MGRATLEGAPVMRFAQIVCLMLALAFTSFAAVERPTVVVVAGAGGEEEFGKIFTESAAQWLKIGQVAGAKVVQVGLTNRTDTTVTNDLDLFRAAVTNESKTGPAELWIVFLGHGTFDGREAKFNLRGPDLSASALSNLLAGFKRPVAIINASSSSAPFIKSLTGTNRVVVTGTRSGSEENYARFGKYVSESIADPAADLDKDGQTSLLEAFLIASRRVLEFYKSEGRLATEHALIDDNGDGFGTPADWFRGIRAIKKASGGASLDGMRANQWHLVRSAADQKLTPEQRARRDDLELKIARLRHEKNSLEEEEYYGKLEKLLTEFGAIELRDETSATNRNASTSISAPREPAP
jgi:hypothetical protein